MGRNTPWDSQDRGDAETRFGEALRRHWSATVLGAAWSALLLWLSPRLFWWYAPVLAGFLLAVPLSAWSSRRGLGKFFRVAGLFVIPEEREPPRVLRRLHHYLAQLSGCEWASRLDGLQKLTDDHDVAALHLSFLPSLDENQDPLEKNQLEGLKLKLLRGGASALAPGEKRLLMLDTGFVRGLLQNTKSAPGGRGPERTPRREGEPFPAIDKVPSASG
jgi:membrane glycosyltransferase